jgi:hypothetical protein
VELDNGGRGNPRPVWGLQPPQLGRQRHQQLLVSASADAAAVPAAPPHPSKLNLSAFWISEPAVWFLFAEAKFCTNHITSQRVMFDLLVAALPETTLAQVMDIINNILAVNPFEVLKLRLLEAHVLSDQEKMDALFQLGLLGDRKPSQLLASMLSVCSLGMEIKPVFQYLFLQWLPQTLRTLLGEQDCGNIRAPGGVSGQVVAVPQAPAARGDGSPGAGR